MWDHAIDEIPFHITSVLNGHTSRSIYQSMSLKHPKKDCMFVSMSTKWNLAGLLISYYLYYHQITTPNYWCCEQIFGSNTTRSLVTSTKAMQLFAENRLVSFFQRGATVHSHVHLQVCREYVYQHDMFNTFKWSIETN